jgi:hypothetical protein
LVLILVAARDYKAAPQRRNAVARWRYWLFHCAWRYVDTSTPIRSSRFDQKEFMDIDRLWQGKEGC